MSHLIPGGGPAFPIADPTIVHRIGHMACEGLSGTDERDRAYIAATTQAAQGMTQRDHFAGLAMQGLLARAFTKDEKDRPFVEWVAEFSYEIADEMLRVREKEPPCQP